MKNEIVQNMDILIERFDIKNDKKRSRESGLRIEGTGPHASGPCFACLSHFLESFSPMTPPSRQ